jgi:hypothetical protein
VRQGRAKRRTRRLNQRPRHAEEHHPDREQEDGVRRQLEEREDCRGLGKVALVLGVLSPLLLVDLGSGRIVASEIEAPNMLAIPV